MLAEEDTRRWVPSARLVLCFMVFWGQIQNYMMRSTLSLMIVAMVKDSSKRNVTNSIETCLENKVYTNTTIALAAYSELDLVIASIEIVRIML